MKVKENDNMNDLVGKCFKGVLVVFMSFKCTCIWHLSFTTKQFSLHFAIMHKSNSNSKKNIYVSGLLSIQVNFA